MASSTYNRPGYVHSMPISNTACIRILKPCAMYLNRTRSRSRTDLRRTDTVRPSKAFSLRTPTTNWNRSGQIPPPVLMSLFTRTRKRLFVLLGKAARVYSGCARAHAHQPNDDKIQARYRNRTGYSTQVSERCTGRASVVVIVAATQCHRYNGKADFFNILFSCIFR